MQIILLVRRKAIDLEVLPILASMGIYISQVNRRNPSEGCDGFLGSGPYPLDAGREIIGPVFVNLFGYRLENFKEFTFGRTRPEPRADRVHECVPVVC